MELESSNSRFVGSFKALLDFLWILLCSILLPTSYLNLSMATFQALHSMSLDESFSLSNPSIEPWKVQVRALNLSPIEKEPFSCSVYLTRNYTLCTSSVHLQSLLELSYEIEPTSFVERHVGVLHLRERKLSVGCQITHIVCIGQRKREYIWIVFWSVVFVEPREG